MASCTSCGTTLQASSRFCSSCGTLVKPEASEEAAPAAVRVDKDVDPLASTAPASLSPLRKPPAKEPNDGPGRGRTVPLAASTMPSQPAHATPLRTPAAPVAPPPAAGPAPGARVRVQWANGQKYPGVVEQVAGAQCLIRFETGERRWIDARYVLPG